MSSDEILSCFIYVIVKAGAYEIPALLTFVCYFTLEEHQDQFDFDKTTLQAAILFITTQLSKLCEPTLHYTYRDDKSCFEDQALLTSSMRSHGSITSDVDQFMKEVLKDEQDSKNLFHKKQRSLYSKQGMLGDIISPTCQLLRVTTNLVLS